MKDTNSLGLWLGVSQKVKAYTNYLMEHDPIASWRAVIVTLDGMGKKNAADAIRHLAEPVTGIIIRQITSCLCEGGGSSMICM